MDSATPATIKYTVGVPGSGKSYTRVRWIIEEFLVNEEGILYTNLPLHIEVFLDYFEKKGYDRFILESRIFVIPSDVLRLWKTRDEKGMPPKNPDYVEAEDDLYSGEESEYSEMQYEYIGPWTYFQHKDISGAHILLDEIQELVHTGSAKKLRTEWNNWLSTIRHENATIEFMTQLDMRVPTELKGIAETKLEIIPNKSKRFPLLPVLNYDWYQMWKGWFDMDMNSSTVHESTTGKGGKKEAVGKPKKYRFDPRFFKFYDTSNRTTSKKKSSRKKEPWELYSKLQLGFWFFRRNYLCCVLGVAYFFAGLFMLNGGTYKLLELFTKFNSKNKDQYMAEKAGMTVEAYRQKKLTEKITEDVTKALEAKHLKQMAHINKRLNSKVVQGKKDKDLPIIERSEHYTLSFIPADNSYAILSDGHEIYVGSVLLKGKFKDKKISKISFDDRSVFLVSGERLTFE